MSVGTSAPTRAQRTAVLVAAVLVLRLPARAAAHGGGGEEASWHTWAAFLSLGLGIVGLAGGLYLDRNGTDHRALADIGVVGGAFAIVVSAVLYWVV